MAAQSNQTGILSRSLIAGSDVIFDYVCQPCSVDDKTLEAVGFCVDCSEFLCDDCFKYHKKPTITRHHHLVDIETAKNDTSISGCLDICTEKCSQHKGKIIEYFCTDHTYLACGVCITMDHRNCKGVQYIPKIAKDISKGEEFSSLIRQLDLVLLQTKVLVDTSLGNKLKSQHTFAKAIDDVKQVRKDVNEALKRLEKEIEKEAEKTKLKDMQKMDDKIKSFNKIQSDAENKESNMNEMLTKKQYCNLFVAMKTNMAKVKSMMISLDKISSDNYVSDYRFQPGEELANFLHHVDSLGTLCKTDGILNKPKKVGGICVGMRSDSEMCNITGMAIVKGGRLVAADCSNKKVKLIDIKQSKAIDEVQLSWGPCDIASIEETLEIAVTQPRHCQIVTLGIKDDRLYSDKTIKTRGPCYGIASFKDKFVVSLEEPESLDVIDKQGNVMHTIIKDVTQQLSSDIRSLAVCQNTGAIYVPHMDKDKVDKLFMSGTVHGVYKDRDLKSPGCVTVDKRGTLYICGEKSSNIVQVTRDCKKARVLLTKRDGLCDPYSVCYDESTDRLYVSQWENNTVLIYQLS